MESTKNLMCACDNEIVNFGDSQVQQVNQNVVLDVEENLQQIPAVIVTLVQEEQQQDYPIFVTEQGNHLKSSQDFGNLSHSSEAESMLFEEEEAPTTSASSVTTGSCKINLEDSMAQIIRQTTVPFLISGIGMVMAGLYLDRVKDWKVFVDIHELFILIPPLVGVKGNLEMTLASRLSTQANLGNMKSLKAKLRLTIANLCLVQCQAIMLTSLASVIALAIGYSMDSEFNVFHGLVLVTSGLVTASLVSFILGIFTALAVIISSACNINPDNVAAPLASSLGDLVTIFCLSNTASLFYDLGKDFTNDHFSNPKIWIIIGALGVCFVILPVCVTLGWRSKSVRPLFKNGWCPIVIAVLVSSLAGFFLKFGIANISPGIAVLQPVFCGIGGNIAAVQASRISTYLHHKVPLGILPDGVKNWCRNPFSTFFSYGANSVAARALAVLATPTHILFYIIIYLMGSSQTAAAHFIPFFILAVLTQVILLLYAADVIVCLLWITERDPDSEAIPYLTAVGDFFGIVLLGLAFTGYHWFYASSNLV